MSIALESFREKFFLDYYAAMHVFEADNFDSIRFAYLGEKAAKIFTLPAHVEYMGFFLDNCEALARTYQLLADDESKHLFVRLLLYRLLGHMHVKIKPAFSWSNEMALFESTQKLDHGPSSLSVKGLFGQIRHFEGVATAGGPIKLDCWAANIVYTAIKQQYFTTRAEKLIGPRPGDVVIDAGACFGDTAVFFAKKVGEKGHVYAFDPLPAHGDVTRLNIEQNGLGDLVTFVPVAVGDTVEDGTGAALSNTKANPGFSLPAGPSIVPVTTIDAFCEGLPRVDFIKMDIEGFELKALDGATRTIAKFKPVLAISLYHRRRDLYEIPLWLAETFPFYDFHLDHYTIHNEETVLFAAPRQ